jgi:hypothetical protein
MSQKKRAVSRLTQVKWQRVAFALLAVCLVSAGSYAWKWWGPTPYAVAWQFARAWERGDVDGLYALLDNVPVEVVGAEGRRRPPREGFDWLMQNYFFQICPPGTRWTFEVVERDYVLFDFSTSQGDWMAVPIRRSLDGKWHVTGMDAFRTLYADYGSKKYKGVKIVDAHHPIEQRFRLLWASAWMKATAARRS